MPTDHSHTASPTLSITPTQSWTQDSTFDDPPSQPLSDIPGSSTWEDDSPYPEVRSAVSNTDDMEIPVDTLRAWTIGLFWAVVIPGLNQFLHFRYPSITIGSLVAQLLSFPLGCAWARAVPRVRIFGVSLNPGPFSLKEHVLITVMATVGSSSAYATDILAVQRKYYSQNWSFLYQWLLVMSTQLIGFSMGGAVKRFLVSPPSMIWPANLVTCALFNTLHSQVYSGFSEKGMSRERFFFYGFLASCIWYIFPGYLFTALSTFSWVTWIWPNNSMSIVTFDWNNIAFIGSPFANVTVGFVFFFWILTPIIYMYDNAGGKYNVSKILTSHSTFDEVAYKQYSPLFISATFAVAYGMSFASITATLVHAALYFRKQIWLQVGRSLSEQPDVHARLMARYPQVPEWWYISILVIVFSMSAITIEVWPTEVPIWGLLLAIFVAAFYIVPVGMIQAITNQQIGLNVIAELVAGYTLPGRPLALMIFKTYGYIMMSQALQFTSDMKLGHYMKVPPRTMFWCQIVATIVAGSTQLGVQQWYVSCFICANTEVFFVASVVWGVIGPQRQFSPGQIYHGLIYFFLIGALAPLAGWLINKRIPVVLAGTGWIPPATAVNYIPWALIGFIFNYVIRKRHFNWWAKYNYVLSAALDCGTAIGTLVVFFALQYPRDGTIGKGTIQNWWGNTVYTRTADQNTLPLRKVVEGEFFG
ncbi:OPT oligopeptide transporter [Russula earlei]|uniref:OPT oligopeptide transporter n=1 Tax=Russula earlei TaxID=71964 RepID=A0ACC0UG80_9AGAM|nr:OPT oligopeptide transporter [Russula earlei]